MLLAFLANSFVYFGFGNIYSSKILNHADFVHQFQTGVYQYRILSGHLLLGIYDTLDTLNLNYDVFKLKFFEERAEAQMYIAFYLLNTLFAVLTAGVLSYLLSSRWNSRSSNENLALACFSVLVMALSQFVIVPYDYSSYFMLLLCAGVLLRYVEHPKPSTLMALVVLIVVSTLNRESSALSLAMVGALMLYHYGWSKQTIGTVFILGVTFVATYFTLRLIGHSNFTTNDGNLLMENLTQPKNWLGAMWACLLFLLTLKWCNTKEQRQHILLFHALALPYIGMCLYTGILYEVRLYVPLFLIATVLATNETKPHLLTSSKN